MNKVSSLAVLALVLWSCGRSPYEGYKALGDDVHIRLYALGEGNTIPADSDSVHLRIRAGWYDGGIGELFSTDGTYLVKDLRTGAFGPVLQRMHEGDSMSVIAPAKAWPWGPLLDGSAENPPDTGMVRLELTLMALRTPAMMEAEHERFRSNDPLGYEQRLIAAYMGLQEVRYQRWGTSALHYWIEGTPSDTNVVVAGDQVTIAYQGSGLEDGRVFDDTRRNGASLTFTFGEREQVMKGLEVAVLLLREGQHGRFVIPSDQAFGAKGIPGILDPYMPVEYTVKLEKVERGKPQ